MGYFSIVIYKDEINKELKEQIMAVHKKMEENGIGIVNESILKSIEKQILTLAFKEMIETVSNSKVYTVYLDSIIRTDLIGLELKIKGFKQYLEVLYGKHFIGLGSDNYFLDVVTMRDTILIVVNKE
jgi:hypothetical protein